MNFSLKRNFVLVLLIQYIAHYCVSKVIKHGFHNTANATTTTQKQSDYEVEQSSFKLTALF